MFQREETKAVPGLLSIETIHALFNISALNEINQINQISEQHLYRTQSANSSVSFSSSFAINFTDLFEGLEELANVFTQNQTSVINRRVSMPSDVGNIHEVNKRSKKCYFCDIVY